MALHTGAPLVLAVSTHAVRSAVTTQPRTEAERVSALQALLSCPTHSIHVDERSKEDLVAAQRGLPMLVPGTRTIYHCGWHSEKSFGGASYLITRPPEQGGNILVDSPRYNPVLASRLEEMGGVAVIFLTHKDDVADHDRWAKHFNAPRIMHALEVQAHTADVEVQLRGDGPWSLDGRPLRDDADAADTSASQLVLTPGHTDGHVCLFYAPERAMLTGDHLSQDPHQPDELMLFTRYNRFGIQRQVESVQKLLQYDWVHAIPGHGRRWSGDAMRRLQAVSNLVQRYGDGKAS